MSSRGSHGNVVGCSCRASIGQPGLRFSFDAPRGTRSSRPQSRFGAALGVRNAEATEREPSRICTSWRRASRRSVYRNAIEGLASSCAGCAPKVTRGWRRQIHLRDVVVPHVFARAAPGSVSHCSSLISKRPPELEVGRCLETVYTRAVTPVEWECGLGHRWRASTADVRRGGWCPICRVGRGQTLEAVSDLAAQRGGRSLARGKVRPDQRPRWECAEGHRWFAKVEAVLAGAWCPACGVRARTFDTAWLHALAQARGGVLTSPRWAYLRQELRFRCRRGHRFVAHAGQIEGGVWCPECHEAISAGRKQRRNPARAQRSC